MFAGEILALTIWRGGADRKAKKASAASAVDLEERAGSNVSGEAAGVAPPLREPARLSSGSPSATIVEAMLGSVGGSGFVLDQERQPVCYSIFLDSRWTRACKAYRREAKPVVNLVALNVDAGASSSSVGSEESRATSFNSEDSLPALPALPELARVSATSLPQLWP